MPVSQLFKAIQSPQNLTGSKISKYHHRVQIYSTEYEQHKTTKRSQPSGWVHTDLKLLLS